MTKAAKPWWWATLKSTGKMTVYEKRIEWGKADWLKFKTVKITTKCQI